MPYYAVLKGRTQGIYTTWAECQAQVTGFGGSIFKKFETKGDAELFVGGSVNISTDTKEAINGAKNSLTSKNPIYIYTDGACSNNGRPNAAAGIGIYFGEGDPRNVSKRLLTQKQTNNVAELEAILQAYPIIEPELGQKTFCIVSDSEYAIRCLTTYGASCEAGQWQKDIPNKDLVRALYTTYKGKGVQSMHVMAHTGKTDVHSVGNDGADRLANEAIGVS